MRDNLKLTRGVPVFLFLFFMFIACASAQWPYTGYVFDPMNYKLLAKEEKDDLSAIVCSPSPDNKAKCFVILHEEYMRMQLDYQNTVERLKACENQ